jgi:hypothetical protein
MGAVPLTPPAVFSAWVRYAPTPVASFSSTPAPTMTPWLWLQIVVPTVPFGATWSS